MKFRDILLSLCAPLLLGFGFAIAKPAMQQFPPFLLMGLRFTIAALILIWWFPIPKKLFKDLFIVSLIGGTLTYGLVYMGLDRVDASSLKRELIDNLDIMVIRELTGGIYFGEPRGVESLTDGTRRGFNTLVYTEEEIKRIARVAFDVARKRSKRVVSVDKANVLEVTGLWREVVTEVHEEYNDIVLDHMYVDNCAMQLVRAPKQFDVIVTTNMFGDILSDEASMLTGSIGMLPSASVGGKTAMYEPIHGSAPDIAGKGLANPLATILSVGMMFKYSFGREEVNAKIESAVESVLDRGIRTRDIMSEKMTEVTTQKMGDEVVAELER